jgi:hypothetical protein
MPGEVTRAARAHGRRSGGTVLSGLLAIVLAASGESAEPPRPCFDFSAKIVDPLRPPLPMIPDRDNSAYGTYRNGIDWAASRALVEMPIAALYAKLLDHRNMKDMKKTTLSTTVLERSGYLEFHHVDVVVLLRALFLKMKIAWAEEWGYSLVEGTREAPRKIVVSYQKLGGTRYLKHQCGSYVLQAHDEATTDVSLYDEVVADRRSAEDTRNMQAGILRNIRARAR